VTADARARDMPWVDDERPMDRRGGTDPLFNALGFPESEVGQPALSALHAGAAFHRLAVIRDVAEAYVRAGSLPAGELAYMPLLDRLTTDEPPRVTAKRLYRTALRMDERLAEAWFNLGRLLQDEDRNGALVAFDRAASLPPHARAQPHARLHANAHWHAATILEDMGQDEAALARYREALARCDNFGVHHVRFAHFLRRLGLLPEAMEHYGRLMTYSHRYFTEFVLPRLKTESAAAPGSTQVEVLYRTTDGKAVVFWNNAYHGLPRTALPVTAEGLAALLSGPPARPGRRGKFLAKLSRLAFWRKPVSIPHAVSISALEP
jgi:tetratricopeptide (TPR) repeat protein